MHIEVVFFDEALLVFGYLSYYFQAAGKIADGFESAVEVFIFGRADEQQCGSFRIECRRAEAEYIVDEIVNDPNLFFSGPDPFDQFGPCFFRYDCDQIGFPHWQFIPEDAKKPVSGVPFPIAFEDDTVVDGEDIEIRAVASEDGIVDIAGDMIHIALVFSDMGDIPEEIGRAEIAGDFVEPAVVFIGVSFAHALTYGRKDLLDTEILRKSFT